MSRQPSFRELLDERLEPVLTSRPVSRPLPPAAPAVLFGSRWIRFTDTAYARPTAGSSPSPRRSIVCPVPDAPRALGPREERAFVALRELGADLTRDFSVADLRRAYRRLARRYHPDGHPGVAAVERARLSRTFAALTDCYRTLQASISPSVCAQQ